MTNSNLIDSYIQKFPPDVQEKLKALRKTIQAAAPEAEEGMGYGVPCFNLNGKLVYFAAFKNHVGFYPTESGITAFKKELQSFDTAKGTVKFPLAEPIPFDLVKRIVKCRVKEQRSKQ